ncbi:hypothetical protein ACLSU7_16960 [Bdellovibrio sp. HCB185ZH]|uniref:hypothetical protein n=1 Tax=Bdellovibrio sp. HCB185ZH TaxID=3394235 RepID=UPI0039A4DA7F
MKTSAFIIILILFIMAPRARAEFMLDVAGSYISENTSSTDVKDDATKYYYNITGYLHLSKKWWAGWSYLGISMSGNSNATGTTVPTSFQTSDTGPAVKYNFGKNESFSLTANYNVLAKGTYKNVVSNSNESWQGTSYMVGFNVMPEIKSGFRMGVGLNYYHAAYSKKTVDGTETSESNTKTWLFPTLTLSKQW